MNGAMCRESNFQWDDVKNVCLGCVEDGSLHVVCESCDDFVGNVDKVK